MQLESPPIHTTTVSTTLPFSFRHRPVAKPRALAMFFHGYSDHGGSFFRRLFRDGIPEALQDVAILIPNGPFPTPVKSETGWREAYSWYFYNDAEQTMLIDPSTAVQGCRSLIQKFGYTDLPKIMVGFSQGGYLAPYLSSRVKNVKEIVAVSTGYRPDFYPEGETWKVTAIHGSKDEIFSVANARKAHAAILARGFEGEFIEIPNLTHVASPEVGAAVTERIKVWI